MGLEHAALATVIVLLAVTGGFLYVEYTTEEPEVTTGVNDTCEAGTEPLAVKNTTAFDCSSVRSGYALNATHCCV